MEQNEFINWIKSYEVKYNGLSHNFFIASHKQGYYNGVLVYLIENTVRTDPMTQPKFSLQTEYLLDISEDAVYEKGVQRLKEIFGDNTEPKLDKSNKWIKW
jgi:hypothetical protein